MIEWDDESGPVSPRFQWAVHAVFDGGKVTLRSRGTLLGAHDGEFTFGHGELALGATALERALEALALVDLVDASREHRVGTRINTLRVNDKLVRYLPSDVDDRLDPTDATRPLRTARKLLVEALHSATIETKSR